MSEVTRDITLEFQGKEFAFKVGAADISKYFNSTTNSNKIAPAHNMLMRTVSQEDKASLKPFLENPVHTMTITSALIEEYAPDLGIEVKKSSSLPSD